ncbi:MAG: hypothetical protein GF401_01180 [Chitinivibrionales bacterium]|nr:hypothetical protein [Chitinivibrionales bacterium]
MSSITIHNIDGPLERMLRSKARTEKTSLNKLIKKLLEQSLGIKPAPGKHADEFREFCGVWSKEEEREFETAVQELRRIEPEEWE